MVSRRFDLGSVLECWVGYRLGGSVWVRMPGFGELGLIQIELGWGGMHGGEITSGEFA